jgi:hypothetical protein
MPTRIPAILMKWRQTGKISTADVPCTPVRDDGVSVGRGFRGTTTNASVQGYQPPLLAVEAAVFCNRPFVKPAPAQGLALRLLRGGGFLETDYITHAGTSRQTPAAADPQDAYSVETGSPELRPETLQQGRRLVFHKRFDDLGRCRGRGRGRCSHNRFFP